LVNQPPSDLDRAHTIRKAIGNGLRQNVWQQFNARFGANIKCIEFYAASEGNCTLINFVSKTGACGFLPLVNFVKRVYPVTIIKIDEQMQPVRDKQGFCIECKAGEKGLLIGMIGKVATEQYNGYANNTEASARKIVENVFAKGQRAFNSGDLMLCDWLGYMFFCDRLGDTYRWRGENVATCEVENVISRHLSSAEVVVYGVEIPGQEGKAGMAAISTTTTTSGEINFFDSLSHQLKIDLPAYAKPLFIRLMSRLEHTGTFKAIKNTLVEEGYNIKKLTDKIYYFDQKNGRYQEMTQTIYENILNCNLRL
jgi:solute carrier family 27 fatty acid transporter 1/4